MLAMHQQRLKLILILLGIIKFQVKHDGYIEFKFFFSLRPKALHVVFIILCFM